MKRLHTQSVPNSNSEACAIVIDGYTTEQSDQLGGKYAFTRSYSARGITNTSTDPRGNTTTSKADIAGRSIEQIDAAGNSSTMSYCPDSDQVAIVTDALGNSINYSYDMRSRKVAEYGTGIQPASYSYDDANRMTAFSTFRVDSGDITTDPTGRNDGDTTSYSYHDATGLLTASTYPDDSQEIRSYNASNMLKHLINARGVVARHSYNSLIGELKSISYSYNPLGQVTSINDAEGTHSFGYNEYSQAESSSQKVNNTDFTVMDQYDELGRSAGYRHKQGNISNQVISQSYDTKGRISTASFMISGVNKDFHYSYLEGTSLLQTLAHPNGISSVRNYEPHRNLVTDINELRGASGVSLRAYSYDAIARPETRKISRSGSVRDDKFEYNSRSELIATNHGNDNYPSGAPPLAQSYRLGTPSEESSGLGVKLLKSQFAYDYLPFGEVSVSGRNRSPLQWSSEVYDEELGLVYYNYRHHPSGAATHAACYALPLQESLQGMESSCSIAASPADGRWINRDPIGIKGGLNLYKFANNNPLLYIDIYGLAYTPKPGCTSMELASPTDCYLETLSNGCCVYKCTCISHKARPMPEHMTYFLEGKAASCNSPRFKERHYCCVGKSRRNKQPSFKPERQRSWAFDEETKKAVAVGATVAVGAVVVALVATAPVTAVASVFIVSISVISFW